MNTEIKLNSRGNLDNKLIQTKEDPYKYQLDTPYNYRVGFLNEHKDKCTFIDPAGGPLISLGDEIQGHKVKAIYTRGIIEFEHE